jgi:uncharacterized protein (DUF2147 family)
VRFSPRTAERATIDRTYSLEKTMRKLLITATTGLLLSMPFAVVAVAQDMNTPVGTWKTIDDVTGKPRSLVEIREVNGKLVGQVVQLIREPTEDQDPVCDKCSGALHNKKVKGMVILWGMEKDGDVWDGGRILDPKTGKIYKAKMSPSNGGKDLDVRGYIGFSLLGRSQTWHREK